jgi:hypothetical protein
MTSTIATPPVRVIAVTADHLDLAGDARAALFLAQALFWWYAVGRRKYYKFNAPCEHPRYRKGDSWAEELRFTRTTLATARRRVAVRVRMSSEHDIQSAFAAGALIVYGTDEHHLTWYMVNEAALAQVAPTLYARLTCSSTSPATLSTRPVHIPCDTDQSAVSTPVATGASPARSPATPQSKSATAGAAGSLHSLMQGCDTGFNTETATETTPQTASKTTAPSKSLEAGPLPTPERAMGEGEEDNPILNELRNRGVQSEPARLIARRAYRARWSREKTLDTFDAHVLDAEQAGVRSPVGVAVSRMLDGDYLTPAPARAVRRIRQLHREKEWAARCAVPGLEARTTTPESVADTIEASPLVTLWKRVLDDIKLQVTRATFEQCFRNTRLGQDGEGYVVYTGDPFTLEWLTHRLHRLIATTLSHRVGTGCEVRFAVVGTL